MSSEKLRVRPGELYTREEVCQFLGCGDWLVDVLVSLFGLTRLGAKVAYYEGENLIEALRRHATNELMPEQMAVSGPETKANLLRLKKEREKRQEESANGTKR